MNCLSTSIDSFPAGLVSNSRQFIDCIDVHDVIAPDPHMPASSSGSVGGTTLNCTLFLFDDKLMIVKRPSDKSGRTLAGFDRLDYVAKGNTLSTSMRRNLVCKGVIDITDVAATDVGGAGMLLLAPRCALIAEISALSCRHSYVFREPAAGPIREMGGTAVPFFLGHLPRSGLSGPPPR